MNYIELDEKVRIKFADEDGNDKWLLVPRLITFDKLSSNTRREKFEWAYVGYRPVAKGEYYLSGAVVMAYLAENAIPSHYHVVLPQSAYLVGVVYKPVVHSINEEPVTVMSPTNRRGLRPGWEGYDLVKNNFRPPTKPPRGVAVNDSPLWTEEQRRLSRLNFMDYYGNTLGWKDD